jgi:Chlorophyllase enzyme
VVVVLGLCACSGSNDTATRAYGAPRDAGGSKAAPAPDGAGSPVSPAASISGAGSATVDSEAGVAANGMDGSPPLDTGADSSAATLPAVTNPGQTGSFAVTTLGSTGPGNNYTLYYPTQIATDGYRHPSLVWGNGALATPSNYTTLLTTIASNGFVIIEYDSTPDAQQMTDAIDWLVEQNAAQGSVLYQHLDSSAIAAGGHSAGSLAVFDVAADPRLVTTVHLSGGTMSPHTELANLRHAALFVCGDVPTGAGLTTGDVANPNCEYDFENATVPVFYGMQKGASHLSTYDVIGDDAQRTQFARAITGWLLWKLAGQQPLATLFVGPSCTLCTDPAWTVEQRGL